MIKLQWLTTAPNPRSNATGHNANQRGWRLHAVEASSLENFSDIKNRRSICGLLPSYGWSLDLFIEDKCKACKKRLVKLNLFEWL